MNRLILRPGLQGGRVDIQEREGQYYLKIHNKQAKEYLMDNNLNKWNQIEDLKGKHEQITMRTGLQALSFQACH